MEYVAPSHMHRQHDRLYASSLRHNTVLVRGPDLQVRCLTTRNESLCLADRSGDRLPGVRIDAL